MSKARGISMALNTRVRVERVMLLPFSKREICAFCTPTNSPNCSWVRCFAFRASLIASPMW